MPDNEPLTRQQAQRHWSRGAIKEFTFAQPPRPKSHVVPRPEPKAKADYQKYVSSPGLPPKGDITVVPEASLPPRRLRAQGRSVKPLYVYPPDGRQVFNDTTYPWRACGRVTADNGKQGAGALVGPRHMLTAGHCVHWTNPGCGWLLFQPDYYDGDVFDSSYAAGIYSYEQLNSVGGEYDVAEDYVVCVLNERLGDQLGYFGFTPYEDKWDGTNYWSHVGYPDDIGGGTKPAWELFFSVANSWSPGFFETGSGLDIETFASLNHGDSGGPVFGWWPEGGPYGNTGAGPYIVAVVSGEGGLDPVVTDPEDRVANWLAGGGELSALIQKALNEFP